MHKIQSVIYTTTIFMSAYLLFLIQPMVAKVLLPILGGSPSVWNTAMVFFQVLLLGGYLYAHLLTKIPSVRLQIIIHAAMIISAALLLPMGISYAPPTDDQSPFLWQITTMLGMIGLPFFMLSTSAPLLQRWFSYSEHPNAENPYFLYASSNIGSVLALILYPTVTEQFLPLFEQTKFFQFGFFGLAIGLLTCGALVCHAKLSQSIADNGTENDTAPSIKTIATWLLLAFVPSSLMLGFTSFVTTDVGSVPMFWVMPLTLYILSFVIAFSRQSFLSLERTKLLFILLFVSCYFVGGFFLQSHRWEVAIVHAILFFLTAIMCHKNLDALKPSPRYLTLFFLIMSLGGALGGIFNALIAPLVFVRPYEYMIAAGLSIICWSVGQKDKFLIPVALVILFAFPVVPWDLSKIKLTYQSRNYFGTLNVVEQNGYKVVSHGTTIHGAQSLDKALETTPVAYYSKSGAMSSPLQVVKSHKKAIMMATLGLGVGSIKCRLDKNDTIKFYEIDPDMIALAQNTDYFTYLSACPAKHEIELGDARIRIQTVPDNAYDVILIDAFSSDNIPMHLITLEASKLYLQKTKPDGLVMFHISNRFFSLKEELALIAKNLNVTALHHYSQPDKINPDDALAETPTRVVVMTSNPAYIKDLPKIGWEIMDATADTRKPWTDDFVNPLRAMSRKTNFTPTTSSP